MTHTSPWMVSLLVYSGSVSVSFVLDFTVAVLTGLPSALLKSTWIDPPAPSPKPSSRFFCSKHVTGRWRTSGT